MVNHQRTLDIDSTHRDRSLWKNPSDFEIPFYTSMSAQTINRSRDPVADAFPSEINLSFGIYPGVLTNTVVLNPSALPYDSVYNNYYIENDCNSFAATHVYSRIISYNGLTRTAILETPILPTNNYNIRKQIPPFRTTFGAGSTTSNLNLGVLASNINNFYYNSYIRIFTGVTAFQYASVISYNGFTRIATILPRLTVAPALGDGYEICYFSRDNFSPLLYNGTTTLNQPVCYDVELNHLIMPNVILKNGSRGLMEEYPYFYVKLYNLNSRPGQTSFITNNPNAREAIFKMPMHIYLKDESFFTLDKCKSIQSFSLKMDDCLRFSVCLPSGEPIVLQDADYESPAGPNPFLQISATFTLRRVK